jgi:hypothetical protein
VFLPHRQVPFLKKADENYSIAVTKFCDLLLGLSTTKIEFSTTFSTPVGNLFKTDVESAVSSAERILKNSDFNRVLPCVKSKCTRLWEKLTCHPKNSEKTRFFTVFSSFPHLDQLWKTKIATSWTSFP